MGLVLCSCSRALLDTKKRLLQSSHPRSNWINMAWVLCSCSRALLVCDPKQRHVCGNPPLPVYKIWTGCVVFSCHRALLVCDPNNKKGLRHFSPAPPVYGVWTGCVMCICSRALLVRDPRQKRYVAIPTPCLWNQDGLGVVFLFTGVARNKKRLWQCFREASMRRYSLLDGFDVETNDLDLIRCGGLCFWTSPSGDVWFLVR